MFTSFSSGFILSTVLYIKKRLCRVGPTPTIINDFKYIPENESVGELLGWTKSEG